MKQFKVGYDVLFFLKSVQKALKPSDLSNYQIQLNRIIKAECRPIADPELPPSSIIGPAQNLQYIQVKWVPVQVKWSSFK